MHNALKEMIESNLDGLLEYGTYRGIEYMIVMSNYSINGYIALPENHPWVKVHNAWDIPADVHGGITFLQGGVIGFDTMHAGDCAHPDSPYSKRCKREGREDLLGGARWLGGHVWQKDEVLHQVHSLIEQANEAA